MPRRQIQQLTDDVVRCARQVRATHQDNYHISDELHAALAELRGALAMLDNVQLPDPDAGHGRWVEGSPETSMHAALTLPKGRRHAIVMQIASCRDVQVGLTDEELERRLRAKHTTVSAARNHLVGVGWLQDSGRRRKGSSGRPTVVWELTEAARRHLRGGV